MQTELERWKQNQDLERLREEQQIARLPVAEQEACRALWAEVEALLDRAR